MFILYFDGQHHEYYHGSFEHKGWLSFPLRPGESFWLVPGTYPEDVA